jgi:hypothetical protein
MIVTSEWVNDAVLLWLSPSGATVALGAEGGPTWVTAGGATS